MAEEKILVVDDEDNILELLKFNLENNSYKVVTASNGDEALKLARSEEPNLILLDLMLPGLDGYELCKEIRRDVNLSHTPIIMITAKSEELDKILGLELGADDYITKPFDTRELIARVKAVLRRVEKYDELPTKIVQHYDLTIDLENRIVKKNGINIELTLKEYELLEVFARNPQKVFSREELLQKAWGYDFMGDTRAVDICITRLRKKIEEDSSNPKHIITVYGFGYRFGGA